MYVAPIAVGSAKRLPFVLEVFVVEVLVLSSGFVVEVEVVDEEVLVLSSDFVVEVGLEDAVVDVGVFVVEVLVVEVRVVEF